MTRIPAHLDPLTVRLPETIDTNFVYELLWDHDTATWSVNPYPVKTYEEARPF